MRARTQHTQTKVSLVHFKFSYTAAGENWKKRLNAEQTVWVTEKNETSTKRECGQLKTKKTYTKQQRLHSMTSRTAYNQYDAQITPHDEEKRISLV